MDFLPEIGINNADEQQRIALQKTAIEYCKKMQAKDGSAAAGNNGDNYEPLNGLHDANYYTQGTIPVAVINTFSEPTDTINTYNTIKSFNPDISVLEFNARPKGKYNLFQKGIKNFIVRHPGLDNFIYQNAFLDTVSKSLLPQSEEDLTEQCLDNISELNKVISIKAVNIPLYKSCTYNELNRLVIQELNTEITPENYLKYRNSIREILESKKNQRFISQNKKIKISQLLNTIQKMENLNIPIYIPSSDDTKSFNILSLAKNAIPVQGEQNDNISVSQTLAKDMKKYCIDSVYNS